MTPTVDRNRNVSTVSLRQTPDRAQRPLAHRFRTSQSYYALDANTNRVVRLDSLTWSILEDLGSMDKDGIVEKYGAKFGHAETASAYRDLLALQNRDAAFLPGSTTLAGLPARETFLQVVEEQRGKLVICLTEACNFGCTACPYSGRDYNRAANNLTWEIARKGIDDYIDHSQNASRKSRFLAFCGGEPLLNLELLKRCVSHARERLQEGVAFDIVTNGSLLSGAAADFLAAEGFSMQVILDGPRAAHDGSRTFTDGTGTWETVIGNLRNFVAHHPEYKSQNNRELEICIHLSAQTSIIELDDFFCTQLPVMLGFHPALWPSTRRCWDPCYIDHTQGLDAAALPGMDTLYGQFLENARRGLIDRDPFNPKWFLQRRLFEPLIRAFVTRRKASPEKPCLDGRSRLYATCTPTGFTYFMDAKGDYYVCERAARCREFRIGSAQTGVDADRCYAIKKNYVELCGARCQQCWCLNSCHVGCYTSIAREEGLTAPLKQAACDRYCEAVDQMLVALFGVLESNPHAFDYLTKNQERDVQEGHGA